MSSVGFIKGHVISQRNKLFHVTTVIKLQDSLSLKGQHLNSFDVYMLPDMGKMNVEEKDRVVDRTEFCVFLRENHHQLGFPG